MQQVGKSGYELNPANLIGGIFVCDKVQYPPSRIFELRAGILFVSI